MARGNNREYKIRTSLQAKQPYTPWDDDQIHAKAKKLYQETGGNTVMLNLSWVKDDLDRQHLVNIAKQVFGGVKA